MGKWRTAFNRASWIFVLLTLAGEAGLVIGISLESIGQQGEIHEPWFLIGPAAWSLVVGIQGMIITKIIIALLDYRIRSSARQPDKGA
ncbi:hypothetical protein PPNSA23_17140 [Phyllobacterium phragmitis]|uniref:DUF4212 domain-containing protein n=2 Tax=Phyllobacterium phragmitis TaxID=2670329 RepID=A0ABQ0GYM4_9HYPH